MRLLTPGLSSRKQTFGFAVRDGALEFLQDGLFIIEDGDRRFRVGIGFAHLAGRFLQAHDAGAGFREVAFRQLEDLAIGMVEAGSDVAGEFQMLRLIGTDWYIVGLVQQDVARP
jgi:hypothetical protein